MREYVEAGGRPPTFIEKRSALLNILPPSFRQDIFFRVPAMQDPMLNSTIDEQELAFARLKADVQRQVELTMQWSAMSHTKVPANVLPGGDPSSATPNVQSDEDLLWLKGKGKGKFGKGKGKGGGKDPLCSNCGAKGHSSAQCPKPQVPWSERPCHRCGKRGRMSWRCPEKPAANSVESEPSAPATHVILLEASPIPVKNRFMPLASEDTDEPEPIVPNSTEGHLKNSASDGRCSPRPSECERSTRAGTQHAHRTTEDYGPLASIYE